MTDQISITKARKWYSARLKVDGQVWTKGARTPQRAVRLAYKAMRRCQKHQCKVHGA